MAIYRKLKGADMAEEEEKKVEDLPGLQQKDWAGVLAVALVGGFFVMLGIATILEREVPMLEALFGIVMTIAIFYFGDKL